VNAWRPLTPLLSLLEDERAYCAGVSSLFRMLPLLPGRDPTKLGEWSLAAMAALAALSILDNCVGLRRYAGTWGLGEVWLTSGGLQQNWIPLIMLETPINLLLQQCPNKYPTGLHVMHEHVSPMQAFMLLPSRSSEGIASLALARIVPQQVRSNKIPCSARVSSISGLRLDINCKKFLSHFAVCLIEAIEG